MPMIKSRFKGKVILREEIGMIFFITTGLAMSPVSSDRHETSQSSVCVNVKLRASSLTAMRIQKIHLVSQVIEQVDMTSKRSCDFLCPEIFIAQNNQSSWERYLPHHLMPIKREPHLYWSREVPPHRCNDQVLLPGMSTACLPKAGS